MNYEEQVVANVFEAVGVMIETKPEFRTEMERRLVKHWGEGGKWQLGQCKICAAKIENPKQQVEVLGSVMQFFFGCCDACTSVRNAHYDRSNLTAQVTTRTPQWDELCPELYKELIADLPATIDHKAFERIAGWRPAKGGRGLICTGNSSRGKTTSLWALFRGLEIGETNAILLTAVELQRQLSEAARDIKDVKHLTHCRVLMVDDLGKEKLTASVAALLWEVIDSRYANRRPMIITTRYVGKQFEDRFGDATLGIDIRRRLLDCCDIVQFRGLAGTDGGSEGGS